MYSAFNCWRAMPLHFSLYASGDIWQKRNVADKLLLPWRCGSNLGIRWTSVLLSCPWCSRDELWRRPSNKVVTGRCRSRV